MKEEVSFQFGEVKKYVQFLLEHPGVLKDISNQYLKSIRSSGIPAMQFLDKLPEEQQQSIIHENFQSFLENILDGTAFSSFAATVDHWRENPKSGRLRKEIAGADILRVYDIQIQLLLNNLSLFTQGIFVFSSIYQELDQFKSRLEEYLFDAEPTLLDGGDNLISSLKNITQDGIITFDPQLKVTEVNAVIERWSRQSPQEILGKPIFEVFLEGKETENFPQGRMIQDRVLRGEKVHIPERPFSRREGFYEVTIVPLVKQNRKISGGVCIVHETTEKRKAEAKLRESQTLLRKVANTSPTILFVYDLEQRRSVFINRTIESVLGYEIDEFGELTQDIYKNLFHPEDVETGVLHLEQLKKLRDEEVLWVEYRMRDREGNWHWFRSLDTVFKRNEKGEVIQFLGNAQDITEQKEAEETILRKNRELTSALEELRSAEGKLRESNAELEVRVEERTQELTASEKEVKRKEEQLRAIADAMPVFISFVRRDMSYGFVNKSYEDFFRVKREEIIGKPVREIIGEKTFQDQAEYIERCLKGETVKFESKLNFFRSERWFTVTFIPKWEEEGVVGIYVLVEDFTELKKSQIELESLLQQLELTNAEKESALQELEERNIHLHRINNDLDNFVHVASHDLRSPIMNLEGLLELLKGRFLKKADSEDLKQFKMLELSASRLKKTVGDLLEVVRLQKEENGKTAKEESVRFDEVAQDVKEDIHNLILRNRATIVEDFKVEEIFFRRSNLRSIIYNLLSNAVKYRSQERPLLVKIATYHEGDNVVLSVKDNGLGMTGDELKKLFTIFQRMHQHVEGTGVGLYSTKRLVESSGGRIDVKSEVGKGTEFLVYFPG